MAEDQSREQKALEAAYDAIMKTAKLDNDNHIIVDIFGSYTWKLNKLSKSLICSKGTVVNKYHPRAYVREYRQNMGTFAAAVNYAARGIGSNIPGLGGLRDIKNIQEDIGKLTKDENSFLSYHSNLLLHTTDIMIPYAYMYGLDDLDCLLYAFPYFDNNVIQVSNSYGETSQVQSVLQKALDNIVGNDGIFGSGNAQNIANIGGAWNALIGDSQSTFEYNNTNVFMERPKYYQFNADGDQINIQFTLYNTIPDTYGVNGSATAEPWQRNFKFIKNFVLKNLPFRSGIFDYRTPCLYSVTIPGQKYFPIAFVSSLNIQAIGTRRILTMGTVTNDNADGTTNVTVPEAWTVQITFKSLLANTANLLSIAYLNGPEITLDDTPAVESYTPAPPPIYNL